MKTIQIREVSDSTYRMLRTRAAAEGLSLTAYLRRQLDDLASRPTMAEWLSQVHRERLEPADTTSVVEVIREHRDRDHA
jgi:plasmid stability protein